MKDYYPAIEPYDTGMLTVSDLHTIYYEQSGNAEGKPVLLIHGGPGAGTMPLYRQFFDPKKYRIILVDQRGCGKSTPHAELEDNTTQALIADFERLREVLAIERWQLFGGSWGATLALAYAQAHPDVVTELVLRGIFLGTEKEANWIFQNDSGPSYVFPEYWQEYVSVVPEAERSNLRKAYYRMLTSEDKAEQMRAAIAFARWELSICQLHVNEKLRAMTEENPDFCLAFARMESYYMHHQCFLEPGQLLNDVPKIQHIPAVIVQGRYDLVCPAVSAWQLSRAWPEADLQLIADAGHSSQEPGIVSALIEATDRFAQQ